MLTMVGERLTCDEMSGLLILIMPLGPQTSHDTEMRES